MKEKAKFKKVGYGNYGVDIYSCNCCGKNFAFYPNIPKYCPYCGVEFETEETPNELNAKIKELYHEEKDMTVPKDPRFSYEEEMESLLDQLTEIANKNAK